MKLKNLTINIFGTEIKIKIGAAEKLQEKHPGKLILPTLADFFTPRIKPKKIGNLRDL